MKNKSAFTFVELSITLVIIGLLMSSIIAVSSNISQKTRLAGARSLTLSSPISSTPNLVAWWETTLDNSFNEIEVKDLNPISIWKDINSNSVTPKNLTQSTSSAYPTYIANGINGLPALRFDGTGDFFEFDGAMLTNSDYTVFVVEQRRSNKSDNYFIAPKSPGNGNDTLTVGYIDNTHILHSQWGNDYQVTVPGFTTPIPRIHVFKHSSASGVGNNYYMNGGATINGSRVDLNNISSSWKTVSTIGKYRNTSSVFYEGDLAEIIIFNRALSTLERNEIEKYLSKKYAITLQ